ncbi:MAG: hypothetical protein JW928_00825 [Candidatus Aureabacteria bacterium]|nr:hypothetical protein [Candidatus Auribacterota bacterium]
MSIKKNHSLFSKIIWTIYLLFLVFLQATEIITQHSFRDYVDLLISLPSIAGLYAYIYRKKLLAIELWKAYFFVFLTWNLYRNIVMEWVSQVIEMLLAPFGLVDIFIYVLLLCPLYYALYKIAFSSKSPLVSTSD